jgi:type IV secretion system protein VirB9
VRLLFALLVLGATQANAQSYPQPGEGDPHIQSVEYDQTKVIRLSLAPGLQTLVELAPGERIETIGVGDSVAWQVSAGKRGDFFFVKNIRASAMTNMTIVTAGRVYAFELIPSSGYGEISPYHVRIVYPSRSHSSATLETKPLFEYRLSGAKLLRPSSVYQEGERTILEWPEETPLPGIFTMENGNEAIVNGEMQDGRFVIAGTPAKLIFRLDRQTAYAVRIPMKAASDE